MSGTVISRMLRDRGGLAGLMLLLVVAIVALFGPFLAPYEIDAPVGAPGQGAGGDLLLGTDILGRDVLSRVLSGGRSVLGLGLSVTVAAYALGVTLGMIAGYTRSMLDPIIMRTVDLILSFPAILTLLLLVAGLGTSTIVLMIGVTLVLLPSICRLVRAATLEASTRGYVEASVARGESTPAILLRDVLPNIAPILLADLGIRFGYSIILIASMNYLGLGLAPPAADWGLMISENRQLLTLNPWSLLVPAALLGCLMLGVNMLADAYVRTMGRSSSVMRRRRPRARTTAPSAPTP